MSIANLLRPNIFNVYADNYFISSATIVGPITATNTTLTAQQCLSTVIILYDGADNIKMPSASTVIPLITNAEVGAAFTIQFLNYGGTRTVLQDSDDGSFKANGPTDIWIQESQTSNTQESRTLYCVISSISPPIIDIY